MLLAMDKLGRITRPYYPEKVKKRAAEKAMEWIIERLNGENGLGAIMPAMVNAYEALLLMGYPKDHPHVVTARIAIDKLLVINEDDAYCQPCVSPVWDTGLAALALQEADLQGTRESMAKAYEWLKSKHYLMNQATGA